MKGLILALGLVGMMSGMVYGQSFTITIPYELESEVIEAFATNFNYQETIPNPDYDPEIPGSKKEIPNPVTKLQFAKQHIRRFIQDQYRVYKANLATEQAEQDALNQAEIDITGIDVK